MSAIVCGKRSIFEDLSATPQISKRIRYSSSSPVRSSPPKSSPVSASAFASNPFDYLRVLFPEMDPQLLERALEECGDDLDSAIRSLNDLRLGSSAHNLGSATQNLGYAAGTSEVASDANGQVQPQVTANGEVPVGEESLPKDGADWVDLFVREMMSASDMDDAKSRASRVLEVLEKSIYTRASADAAQNFHQENIMLKEQVETLIHENTVLKRAVAIQHERQKELDDRNQELQQLKQVVSQYQEQLRTLEVNNYALTLHLKQAQQSNSIPGRFHPDVF